MLAQAVSPAIGSPNGRPHLNSNAALQTPAYLRNKSTTRSSASADPTDACANRKFPPPRPLTAARATFNRAPASQPESSLAASSTDGGFLQTPRNTAFGPLQKLCAVVRNSSIPPES